MDSMGFVLLFLLMAVVFSIGFLFAFPNNGIYSLEMNLSFPIINSVESEFVENLISLV